MFKFNILIILIIASNISHANVKAFSYRDFIETVLVSNSSIIDSNLEWEIAKQDASNVHHDYSAKLTSQIGIEKNKTPNTASESQSAALFGQTTEAGLTFYDERNENFAVGVEKKIKTGGVIKLSASIVNLDNNKQPEAAADNERRGFIGVSFSQPLLRGKGSYSETEVRIAIADVERDVAYQNYRKVLSDTIRNSSDVYWSLFLAQERLNIRKKSASLLEKILKDTQFRIEQGYSARLEHNSVTAALTRRKIQVSEAERFVSEQSSIASQLLLGGAFNSVVKAQDKLVFQRSNYSHEHSIQRALMKSPSILSLQLKSQQEKVRINFERNKRLPQLDLNLSYGKNALRNDTYSLTGNKHDSWYVGLEFSTTLDKRSAQGNQRSAQLRERRIRSLLRSKENEIRNRILAVVRQLDIAGKDIRKNQVVLRQEKHIHNAFLIEKKSGDRALNSLLRQELELNRAKEDLVTAKVSYHRLLISLWAEEGTLLSKFNLE